MSHGLKLFCIWCMVLVLPLQSLAAGCRLACAGPHGTATALAGGADAATHPCHATAAEAGDALATAEPQQAADADHHCDDCAACCAVVALPVGTLPTDSPAVVREGQVQPLPRPAGIVVAGLERPPRTLVR